MWFLNRRNAIIATICVVSTLMLLVFGVVMLMSIESQWREGIGGQAAPPKLLLQQLACMAAGIVFLAGGAFSDYRAWQRHAAVMFLVVVLLLILGTIPKSAFETQYRPRTMFPAAAKVNIPTADLASPAIILMLAAVLAKGPRSHRVWFALELVIAVTFLTLAQPAWNSALLVALVSLAMLLTARARWNVVLAAYVAMIAVVVVWLFWDPLRAQRILHFIGPDHNVYSRWWPEVALERGGWAGVGLGWSNTIRYYWHEASSDFMLALIGEELGWITVCCVLGLILWLMTAILTVGAHAADRFGFLLATGIAVQIGVQTVVHLAVIMRILPIHSLPLPFVSLNGANVCLLLCAIGVLLSIARHNQPADIPDSQHSQIRS